MEVSIFKFIRVSNWNENKKQILSILFFLATTGTVMGQNQTTPAVQIPDSLQILDKDPNFTTYTAAGFDQCWAAYPGAQLVDVRTADEYAKGHIASARNIDVKKRLSCRKPIPC